MLEKQERDRQEALAITQARQSKLGAANDVKRREEERRRREEEEEARRYVVAGLERICEAVMCMRV